MEIPHQPKGPPQPPEAQRLSFTASGFPYPTPQSSPASTALSLTPLILEGPVLTPLPHHEAHLAEGAKALPPLMIRVSSQSHPGCSPSLVIYGL